MKILISAFLFLFLSGTYGASITMQDEKEPPKPSLREAVKSILHQSFLLSADLVAYWESPEAERNAALKQRSDKLMNTVYYDFGFAVVEHLVDIYKEVNKEVNETHPVFNNKVIPTLGAVFVHGLQSLRSATQEIQPYFEKFEKHVKEQQNAFWEEVRPTIQNKLKPIIAALNAGLKPFIDDVRKEVANYKEHSKSPSDKDPKYPNLDAQIKQGEFLQKIFMFDEEVLNTMMSQLDFFNTNA